VTRGDTRLGRLAIAGAVAACALVAWCAGALARPGALDGSFGKHGKVAVDFGGSDGFGADVAVAPDGDVILAGETSNVPNPADQGEGYAVAALDATGSLDNSFSGDGRAVVQVGPKAQPEAVAVQPDGKVLVAGAGGSTRQMTVIRLTKDGNLDDSFGSGGIASFNVGIGGSYAFDLTVQKDGKIVVVGKASGPEQGVEHTDFGIARLNPDGTLDDTFSDDGVTTLSFGGVDYARAVAVTPHGKIVIAGQGGSNGSQMIATRLLPDGAIDRHFGSKGRVTVRFRKHGDASGGAFALALQKNGDAVLEGYAGVAGDSVNEIGVARLLANGRLDHSFSGDGRQLVGFPGGAEGHGVAVEKDGRIDVGGFATDDLAVARLKANGSPDHAFGSRGKKTLDFGGSESGGELALSAGGRIVVAGETTKGSNFVGAELKSR
jgi:uncharacterized delta-60 repeat protein